MEFIVKDFGETLYKKARGINIQKENEKKLKEKIELELQCNYIKTRLYPLLEEEAGVGATNYIHNNDFEFSEEALRLIKVDGITTNSCEKLVEDDGSFYYQYHFSWE